jgi:hypothetical protein
VGWAGTGVTGDDTAWPGERGLRGSFSKQEEDVFARDVEGDEAIGLEEHIELENPTVECGRCCYVCCVERGFEDSGYAGHRINIFWQRNLPRRHGGQGEKSKDKSPYPNDQHGRFL